MTMCFTADNLPAIIDSFRGHDMANTRKTVTRDNRGRVSLAGIGKDWHTLYLVADDEDGTIILVPAKVEPITEIKT